MSGMQRGLVPNPGIDMLLFVIFYVVVNEFLYGVRIIELYLKGPLK